MSADGFDEILTWKFFKPDATKWPKKFFLIIFKIFGGRPRRSRGLPYHVTQVGWRQVRPLSTDLIDR